MIWCIRHTACLVVFGNVVGIDVSCLVAICLVAAVVVVFVVEVGC